MEVSSLLASAKIAYDLAKGIASLKTALERDQTVSKLLEVLISVQTDALLVQKEHSLLTAKKDELEKECLRLKDWTAEKERYHRKQIAPGIFAYVETGSGGSMKSTHKYCCNCFDKTVQSTLQRSYEPKRMIGMVCPNGCPKLVFIHYLDQNS